MSDHQPRLYRDGRRKRADNHETVEQIKHKPGVCSCGRLQKRSGQGNCNICHATAQQVYRARRANRRAEIDQASTTLRPMRFVQRHARLPRSTPLTFHTVRRPKTT